MVHKISLVGKRFNRLLVVKELPRRPGDLQVRYLCKCDCGNTVETDAACLRGGKGSCGCIRREKRAQKEIRDLVIKKLRMQRKKNKNTQEKFKLVSESELINRIRAIREVRQNGK